MGEKRKTVGFLFPGAVGPRPLACLALVLALVLPGGGLPWEGQAWPIAPEALAEEQPLYAISDVTEAELAGEQPIDPGPLPEFVPWLLEIAQDELGYREGAASYTKYGEWAGDPYAEWCAEFVCWCVDQVDRSYDTGLLNDIYPNYSGQNTGRDWFITKGRFVYRKGNCPDWGYQWLWGETALLEKNGYIPRPGDWVFFSYNEAGDTEHVALVEYCTRDMAGEVIIHVIEGNNPSSVQRNTYYLNNSQVLGFGTAQEVVGTTMRSGNRGDRVLWLQQSLHQLGYLEEKHLTGSYGGNTKNAVAAFQGSLPGKTINGIADMETQNALRLALEEKEFYTADTWLVEE